MAALRGPSVTRRSSRFSSPATVPKVEKESAGNAPVVERTKNASKPLWDNWVEPPTRAPVPSFEDHRGLERVGVLEHFQPLGQPPTQKLLQKLKLAPPKPGRSTPVPNDDLGTPMNGVEEMSTASPLEEPQESQSTGEVKQVPVSTTTPPVRRVEEKEDEDRPAAAPASTVARSKKTSRNSTSIPPMPLPTGGYIYHGHYHPETIKQHVDAAVKKANTHSPELVPGLRKLCADSEVDPALWAVLDAVLNQSPSREQYKTFHRYIRTGKKEYSRTSTPAGHAASPERAVGHHHDTPAPISGSEITPSAASVQQLVTTASSSQSPLQAPQIFHPQPTQPVPRLHIQPPSHLSSSQPSHLDRARAESTTTAKSESPQMPSPSEDKGAAEMATAGASGVTSQTTTTTTAFQHGLQNLSDTSRKRSRSASSSSSLSSAKSLDAETFAPAINREAQINGTRAAAKSASDHRQATTHKVGAKRGPKVGLFSIFPNTNKTNARKQAGSEIDELELSRRKQRFQQHQGFHEDYNSRYHTGQSSERSTPVPTTTRPATKSSASASITAPVVHPYHAAGSHGPTSCLATAPLLAYLRRGNGAGKKRPRDEPELDEQATQTSRSSPETLQVPSAAGLATVSRSDTPRSSRLPPAKRIKKSARVMVSPNKPKNGGVTAGVARAGPGRDSAVGNGVESSEEENNDYCGACGGNGELLCCDGCPNSFHFSCLDPPMKGPPEGSWYCVRCMSRQPESSPQTLGLLGKLILRSGDINPKAFGLPFAIRDYFDGIRTGDEGEYEDVGMPRTQTTDIKMNRAGFIEEPDYKKLKDARGNVIYCYRCRRTSNGKRDIIPCDFCPNRWHLDCLDPPLAVPPRRGNGDKPNATWRCPLHIDGDLRSLGDGAEGHSLERLPRHRVPKNPTPRDVSMSQGFRNHGVIDVNLMKDDERIDDIDMQGTIYRLPERGIRLDFLDRVRRARYEATVVRQQYAAQNDADSKAGNLFKGNAERATMPSARPEHVHHVQNDSSANVSLRAKALREQQAVLSLQMLAQQDEEASSIISGDRIAQLTDQLVLGADEELVDLFEQEEVHQLERLRKLIDIRLNMLQGIRTIHEENENPDTKPHSGSVVVNGDGGGRTRAAARRSSEPPNEISTNPAATGIAANLEIRSTNTPKATKAKSASTSKSREERRVSRGRK